MGDENDKDYDQLNLMANEQERMPQSHHIGRLTILLLFCSLWVTDCNDIYIIAEAENYG